MDQIYLSRRNLLILLSKLDRQKEFGDITACSIIKCDDQHPTHPQTMSACMITAVEDEEYYVDRQPGEMLAVDEERVSGNKAGS